MYELKLMCTCTLQYLPVDYTKDQLTFDFS
jgi:hypothetical protein